MHSTFLAPVPFWPIFIAVRLLSDRWPISTVLANFDTEIFYLRTRPLQSPRATNQENLLTLIFARTTNIHKYFSKVSQTTDVLGRYPDRSIRAKSVEVK
jgi:hypothetical protein